MGGNKWLHRNDCDWNTPSYVWDKIIPHIPKGKTVWCPFYNDGYAGEYLNKKEIDVIHNKEDFWETHYDDVVVCDNPPYKVQGIIKVKGKIMERLIELNTPFMLLLPSTTIQTKYFKNLCDKYGKFQLIVPREKYDYEKFEGQRTKCLFYTLWVCWNIGLKDDFIVI